MTFFKRAFYNSFYLFIKIKALCRCKADRTLYENKFCRNRIHQVGKRNLFFLVFTFLPCGSGNARPRSLQIRLLQLLRLAMQAMRVAAMSFFSSEASRSVPSSSMARLAARPPGAFLRISTSLMTMEMASKSESLREL